MTQVAVIGSGPSALFAALAVEHAGHEPIIFAKGEKSPMFGAMYLHEAIPGICNPSMPDYMIDIIKSGSREGYAYNVYGESSAACSWDSIPAGLTPAWDLSTAYDRVWNRYKIMIKHREVTRLSLGPIVHNFPLVLNSAPAPLFCAAEHNFLAQDIWVIHGPSLAKRRVFDDIMYYNGVPWDGSFDVGEDDPNWEAGKHLIGHEWYRFSQINGYQAWEYSHEPVHEEDNPRTLSAGKKPLTNDCWCWESWPSYRRIGRYGRWKKGVLTHHAYREAAEACRAL